VVRLGSMGDVIHTLPAVTALRQAFPQASIGWVVEERWCELLCTLPTARSGPRSPQRPLVDRLHVLSTKSWRSSLTSLQTWEQIAAAISALRAGRYQVAVDFQGAARSALIARFSGAPVIFGASQPREGVASMFYTRQVMTRGEHVVDQSLSIAESVTGVKATAPQIEFPHDPAAEQFCEQQLSIRGLKKFVLMNPGAGWGAKQWPAERYGEVALRLAEYDLGSLINFGPGERILAQAVEVTSKGTADAISCSLAQLIALTKRASLFIGGDTGPMHLAAALGVPVVGLFGPTNPARNGPYGTCSAVLRSESSITSHSRRRKPDPGLLTITVDQAVAAGEKLLRGRPNA
jgi:heptosyltransferase-1